MCIFCIFYYVCLKAFSNEIDTSPIFVNLFFSNTLFITCQPTNPEFTIPSFFSRDLLTVWPQPIWKKVRTWWQIPPQHQSTYLGGPESASIEIPPFRSFLWCKFSKFNLAAFHDQSLFWIFLHENLIVLSNLLLE